MQPDPTSTALAACGRQCLQATNGHHRRWAVQRCTDALLATGATPAIARGTSLAMAAVARAVAERAATWPAHA